MTMKCISLVCFVCRKIAQYEINNVTNYKYFIQISMK